MNGASANAALDRLWARTAAPLVAAMDRLALEIAKREYPSLGERPNVDAAKNDLNRVVLGLLVLSDLIGRRSTLRAADAFGMVSLRRFAAPWTERAPVLPHVVFEEMVNDLLIREPRLVDSAAQLAELYGKEHVFAVTRSAEIETTERIQRVIGTALKQGVSENEAVRRILRNAKSIASNADDWTRAYAETVWRTNSATAASAGRFAQIADPNVAAVIGGFRYTSAGDMRVRANHHACDGVIASADDPVWSKIAPPLGFNAVESGAMVTTQCGEVPIEQVKVGDRVLSHNGEWARVYGVDRKRETKTMVDVSVDGGARVSVTSDHKVLTRRGWVAAGMLTEDDEVVVAGCKACGTPVPEWRVFCSTACRNARSARVDRSCETCGARFSVLASRIRLNPRFCSNKCKDGRAREYKHPKKHGDGRYCELCGKARPDGASRFCGRVCQSASIVKHRKCVVCGVEIRARGKKKAMLVCGVKCRGVYQRTKPDRPCAHCGTSLRERAVNGRRKWTYAPNRKFCSFRCYRCYRGETSIEKAVREYLEANGIAYVQHEQVGRFEVDFILPQYAVAVECDGTYWHSKPSVRARDARKDAMLSAAGIAVLRIAESEIRSGSGWQGRLYAICTDRVSRAV